MQWYFWLLIILLVLAVAGIVAYMLHKKGYLNKIVSKISKKRPIHEDYIWVGQGEHPFKEKEEK